VPPVAVRSESLLEPEEPVLTTAEEPPDEEEP
jgi:hypothetical protein